MFYSVSLAKQFGLAGLVLMLFLGSIYLAEAATTTIGVSQDTFSTTFSPSKQRGDRNFIRVQDVNKTTHKYKHMHRGFVQTDVSSIPNDVVVNTATLRLYVSEVSKAGLVDVQMVSEAWDESSLTMKTVPNVDFITLATLDVSLADVGSYVEIDLTDQVASWVSASSTNHGLMLSPRGTAVEFGTKEGGQAAELYMDYSETIALGRPYIISTFEDYTVGFGETATIYTNPDYIYDYTVDWGDGTVTQHTGDASHVYLFTDVFEGPFVKITGDFPAPYSPGGENDGILTSVLQWGDTQWQSMERAFYDPREQLGIVATDTPKLSEVESMSEMFASPEGHGSTFEGTPIDFSLWDTSNVTDMSRMFQGQAFSYVSSDAGLSNWDVSNVTNMGGMFNGVSGSGGIDLTNWDTSSVTDMSEMFANIDQLSSYVGDLSGWNVSNVTSTQDMFTGATLDQGTDLSSWDTSSVTNMSGMFGPSDISARTLDDIGDISTWNTSQVADMSNLFDRGYDAPFSLGTWDLSSLISSIDLPNMSPIDYSGTLIGWATQSPSLNSGVNANSFNQYNNSATSSRDLLINTHNWTINDGGLEL
jgi:surface protein